MFLHLGGNTIIPKKDIIAIINIKTSSTQATREFLEIANDEGFIKTISKEGKEKSFIITNKEIYISPISCSTLKKRTGVSI
ncbi:MAG: extracellular matrix regulator RemB [Bacillota bacterium]